MTYFWIALGYLLCGLAGAVLGCAATIKAFLMMHNNSLPAKRKAKP